MIVVWVGVLVAVVLLAYAGMWRGWKARAARQARLPEPQPLDVSATADTSASVAGTYVSTTRGGHWMDRVTAHGLGTLGRAQLAADDAALLVVREGARSFRIPADDLLSVRRERGIAGKVREPEGIVVVTWRLGDHELDTGFRPERAREADDVERMVARLRERVSHG
jgi:hypothetical protein